MRRLTSAMLAAFFLFWAAPLVQAGPSEVLEAKWLPSAESFAQGGSYPMALRLNIAPGMHINSNQPDDPNLIATRVELSAPRGLSWSAPRFPQAKRIKLGFADKQVLVFDKVVLIRASLSVGPKAKPGPHQVSAKIFYQGCNNDTCLMPESQEIPLTVQVTAAGH
jgi:DsbC/DsbD-like thiol-disulfide interchange protein